MMNPEIEKEVLSCVRVIREGGFILFPSEIGWSIGCDASDSENINAIMSSPDHLFPAILLDAPGRLGKFVKNIPDAAWDLIEFTNKPLHLFMEETISFPSSAFNSFEQVAFRIAKDDFTRAVTSKTGKPVFAAVLASPAHPAKKDTVLNKNCYVVNLRAGAKANPDSLVVMKFATGGKFEIIRK